MAIDLAKLPELLRRQVEHNAAEARYRPGARSFSLCALRARGTHKEHKRAPLAVLLRSACWRSLPPSSSAAATAAAPAPPQRSVPSIKSKRNRPAPRSQSSSRIRRAALPPPRARGIAQREGTRGAKGAG
jgi:hypothetical protein